MLQDTSEVVKIRLARKKLEKLFTQEVFNTGIFLLLTHCQIQPSGNDFQKTHKMAQN